ncbi:MAG: hypothetical protein HC817_02535 [Saprospiraceae bacterium]|nr:hypothetical protein [Saprospiraceae bacterium]
MKINSIVKFAIFGVILFASCKKDEVTTEEEPIAVLEIKAGSSTFIWSDTDGAGGVAPKIDTIRLKPNATETFTISVRDAAAKNLTDEIVTEKDEHLFIFKPSGNLTVSDLSKDSKGKDFGQAATLKTTAAGAATLQVILKHEPDKSAADPSKTGETDIDVVFPVVIK